VSIWLALLLADPQGAREWQDRCVSAATERDVRVCEHIERVGELEINSVESVALGSEAEMRLLRQQARDCELINVIDYVAPNVSIFKIINADQESRQCFADWMRVNKPDLLYTRERLERLVTAQ